MANRFMGIGGVDYPSQEAKAIQVNDIGEIGFENVVGRVDVLDAVPIAGDATESFDLTYHNVPKGAAYVGIYITSSSFRPRYEVTYAFSKVNSFGHSGRFTEEKYDLDGHGTYIIRPTGITSNDGALRVSVKNNVGTPVVTSMWLVFYRFAIPQVHGLVRKPIYEAIETRNLTVLSGDSGVAPILKRMNQYDKFYVTIRVTYSHDWSARIFPKLTADGSGSIGLPLTGVGTKGHFISDTFTSTSVSGIGTVGVTNRSSSTQDYVVTTFGRRSQ